MLGVRSNAMDCGSSPAEFISGITLRIPGEFVLPENFAPNPQTFLEEFCEHMHLVKPVLVEHRHKRNVFIHKNLSDCSHVFLKVGPVKKSLEPPYSGPHRVVARPSDLVIDIDVNGKTRSVSMENVKPAFFLREAVNDVRQTAISATNVPVTARQPVALDLSSDNVVQPVNGADTVLSCKENSLNLNLRPPLKSYSKKRVNFST